MTRRTRTSTCEARVRRGNPWRLPFQSIARRCGAPIAAVAVGIATAASPGFAAPSLETLVLSVGGVSVPGPPGCTSFIAPSSLIDFFGDYGVGLPVGGLALCGIPGGVDEQSSPTGPLTDERTLVNSWPSSTYDGTSSVVADYGRLNVQAQADHTGDTSSLTVTGAEGFAIAADGLTITSAGIPNGQPGTVVFRTTVTGGLSTSGPGTAGLRLDYHVNAGAAVSMLRSNVGGPASLPSLVSIGNIGLEGFTRTPGHLSGSGEVVTAAIPIVFGTRFEFRLGLLAYAVPTLTALGQSGFTGTITGIEVKGPGGVAVPDFVVVSDSGTDYGAGGVLAVGDELVGWNGVSARLAAFPNPSAMAVQLNFSLDRTLATSLDIYDAAGRQVRHLGDFIVGEGARSAVWDGRGDRGMPLPSGIYYARLSWRGGSTMTRITRLR